MKRSALWVCALNLSLMWSGLGAALVSPVVLSSPAHASGGAPKEGGSGGGSGAARNVIRFQMIAQTFNQGIIDGQRSLFVELVFKEAGLRAEFLEILPKIHDRFNHALYGEIGQKTPLSAIRRILTESIKAHFGEQKASGVECVVVDSNES